MEIKEGKIIKRENKGDEKIMGRIKIYNGK